MGVAGVLKMWTVTTKVQVRCCSIFGRAFLVRFGYLYELRVQ